MFLVIKIIIVMVALILSGGLAAQDQAPADSVYPAGISIAGGTGHFAVTDEYISKEKYSGSLPYFSFNWSRMHESYGYRLGFMFRSGSNIKNHNISTEITEALLSNHFLYPLAPVSVFGRPMSLFAGPSSEFYIFYNKPDIAVSGFDYAQSFAALLSLGGRIESYLPLSKKFVVEGGLGLGLLSLGLRMVDSEEDDASPARLLTVFSGTHGNFDLGIRYRISEHLSVRAGYTFQLTWISSWDPLLAASDNMAAVVTYEY
jgi:hypothetical protein